jgi:ankyrin repeat protein
VVNRICIACLVLVSLVLLPVQLLAGSMQDDWVRGLNKRDLSVLQRLVEAGADVNVCTDDGKTALMFAAGRGRADLAAELLRAGAEVNTRNRNGGTALMYAAVSGNPAIAELLIRHGAEVNVVGANGWTAITIAAVKGHDQVVRMLLAQGANPNPPDIYGWTPLMRAAYEHRTAVVRTLLENKQVKVNAQDDLGATALHHAAAQGDIEIARMLLKAGVDPNITDSEGRSPARIAELAGHKEIVDLIGKLAAR